MGGNLTNDSTQSFAFDAENKIKTVSSENDVYRYDGDGNRVRKNFTYGEKVRMVYSSGLLIDEYHLSNGSLKKEYVYGAKGLIATIEPGVGAKYTTADHLGSPRMVTGSTGAVFSRHDYKPFGEDLGAGFGGRTTGMGYDAADGLRQKFTGKERDNETGLDYFLARYYSSTQGRFTSPDEFTGGPDELFDFAEDASDNPTFYAELDNPQSLNKYQYTYNNPLNMVDPDGHCPPCFGPSISLTDSIEFFTDRPRALDKLQLKISGIGMVPGAGEIADLVNAGISAVRGNRAEAAVDVLGAAGPVFSAVAVGNRIRKSSQARQIISSRRAQMFRPVSLRAENKSSRTFPQERELLMQDQNLFRRRRGRRV